MLFYYLGLIPQQKYLKITYFLLFGDAHSKQAQKKNYIIFTQIIFSTVK